LEEPAASIFRKELKSIITFISAVFHMFWKQVWLWPYSNVLQSAVEFEHRSIQLCVQYLSAHPRRNPSCSAYVRAVT